MFITPALAQGAAEAVSPASNLIEIAPWVLVLVVFYFLLMRPQILKDKQQKAMLADLKQGDEIVTSGGIIGVISKLEDDVVTIETAASQRLRIVRSMIDRLYIKAEPAAPATVAKGK